MAYQSEGKLKQIYSHTVGSLVQGAVRQGLSCLSGQQRTPKARHSLCSSALLVGVFVILAYIGLGIAAPLAHADEEDITSACMLSDAQREIYAADGSLAERIAYTEALGNDRTDPALIAQARLREAQENGEPLLREVPSNWKSGMGTTGSAHIVVLRVDFPGMPFSEGDTLEALQGLFFSTEHSGDYPYESVKSYYERASYGTLVFEEASSATLNYTAQNPRDHYKSDHELLIKEAFAALDKTTEFSRFDGNGDNVIDAIYLHFAGGDEGWGSAWWSNEWRMGSGVFFDGKELGNAVFLSESAEPSTRNQAVKTAIHETGHVLGLPDYYSFNDSAGVGKTGILTFDMMMNNTGDHNGFSK